MKYTEEDLRLAFYSRSKRITFKNFIKTHIPDQIEFPKYTIEDLKQAFYKGRVQGILPDDEETTMYIRSTFMGYLRELDGIEDPYEIWQNRVQSYIDRN